MATVSAAFPCKSANPSAPQRGTTPTKITLAPLIHPAFPFENDQASQRLALNPISPDTTAEPKRPRGFLLRGFSDACLRASARACARQASENP
jgi:hypothetical protein